MEYSPMVVINVIEYKNADAYDHLWVRIGVCTPAVFCIFVDRTARNRVSCKRENIYEISVVNLRQTNEVNESFVSMGKLWSFV